jgi:hypothetical protein
VSRNGGLWEEPRRAISYLAEDFRDMTPNRDYNHLGVKAMSFKEIIREAIIVRHRFLASLPPWRRPDTQTRNGALTIPSSRISKKSIAQTG